MSEKIATREAYGKALVELGAANDKIVVLDADLAGATMTKYFKAAYPDRFFDCGIAECNMMDVAAGLSTMGLIPFCSTFAMFGAGRAYEQIRNSIAYPRFNVKICCSHAGVSVGEDGGSHQSIEDIGLMRMIPGMTVIVPADGNEARKATFALAQMEGPAYLRTARLASPVFEQDYPFEIGKANVLREGKDATVFACGLMVSETLEAAELLEVFQWSGGDLECAGKRDKVREELADVLSYCILMADVCGLDLDEIMNEKVTRNEAKYPVEKAWGNAAKYTELE